MTKKKQLLDEDDESMEEPTTHQLHINTKYATEFEKRKRLEELQNARQALDSGSEAMSSDTSSSSEEDEDAILSTPLLDVKIIQVGILFLSLKFFNHLQVSKNS